MEMEKTDSTPSLDPQEKLIQKVYYNPKKGFLSSYKLYRKIRDEYEKEKQKKKRPLEEDEKEKYPTLAKVRKVIRGQYAEQVLRPPRRPAYYNTIWAPSPGFNYQMDILVYQPTKYETEQGYKYIFVIIDVHSRKAGARPMKTKNEWWPSLFHDIIKKDFGGIYPKHVNCDNEFATNAFIDFCKKNNITLHTSEPHEPYKNAIVERFNRTLALRIQKWRESTGQTDWTTVLPDILQGYNESWHRTIQATPQDVWDGKDQNHQIIIHTNEEKNFQVGDQVFIIQRKKHPFAKGDRIQRSTSAYIIIGQKGKKFQLQNMDSQHVLKRYYKGNELRLVGKGGEGWSGAHETKKEDPVSEVPNSPTSQVIRYAKRRNRSNHTIDSFPSLTPRFMSVTPSNKTIDRTLIQNQKKALKIAKRLRREDLGHKVETKQKEGKAQYQLHRSLQPMHAKREPKPVKRLLY
jgi:transposase InsO family protein